MKEKHKISTTTGNQFLISSTETFSTEQAENNTTTTYSSSENNKTATTTTEVKERTETEIENETALDVQSRLMEIMQRSGKKHHTNYLFI